jgi:hypothetical protein
MVLYVCETWSLTLREERILRLFENRVLRRIFGLKRNEVKGGWINCIMRNFIIYTLHRIRHVARMRRKGMHIGFWREKQNERNY